jgi:hypothetical protein
METYESAVEKIRTELTGSLDKVKQEFTIRFGTDLERFIDLTAQAFLSWLKLDSTSRENEKRAIVSGLVFSTITLHIISMRLFLTGYIVAAGNIQRQVLETIALAILCSCKSLDVLARFLNDTYSANNAMRDVLRHADKMNVNKDNLTVLRDARDFYHMYSHPSKATLASHIRFSDVGRAIYVGSSFDQGKLEQYRKEIAGRIGLAEVIPNFVGGVQANVDLWEKP